jgi:polycystin 2
MVHDVNIHFTGLWRTRQTEDMDSDREMHVKTTLRELVIYIFFIVILCICK